MILMSLEQCRYWYAEEVRYDANLRSERIFKAFATVPREKFLGPGPWKIEAPKSYTSERRYIDTPSDDPRHVYHNALIAIDANKHLNNGHPQFWASMLEAVEPTDGEHVVHVGCGTGYYSAILADLVGASGRVMALEVDETIAARARANLSYLAQVEVVHANGADYVPEASDVIIVNAGTTRIFSSWLTALRPEGRLLVPLTVTSDSGTATWGKLLRVVRLHGVGYQASFLGAVGIYPFVGGRDDVTNRLLSDALKRGGVDKVCSVRLDPHPVDDSCWLHAETFCLSQSPCFFHSLHLGHLGMPGLEDITIDVVRLSISMRPAAIGSPTIRRFRRLARRRVSRSLRLD
jgi:protein-L-isoaspartate(D-aspartate) O-methyltransferase